MLVRAGSSVLLIFLLVACGQSGTSPRAGLAPTTPSVLAGENVQVVPNTQDVERPNRGHFVFNVDHVQVPAGCSPGDARFCPTVRSTFEGRCSVPSNFVEFGEGTGEMTHGGRTVVSWTHCTRVSATKEITFRDGRMTMETANGDRVTTSYGIGALSLVNDGVSMESPFIITGGTGRFEGASGHGTMHGEAPGAKPANLLDGRPFEATITGTITYAPGRGGQ